MKETSFFLDMADQYIIIFIIFREQNGILLHKDMFGSHLLKFTLI
jgi:hypothetical protein